MTTPASAGKEWRIRLDLQLDEQQHDRVTRAIQSAVLAVVAEFDIASDYSVRLVGPASRGHPLPSGNVGTYGHSCDVPTGFKRRGKSTKVGNAPAEFAAIIKNEALEPISFVSAKSLFWRAGRA